MSKETEKQLLGSILQAGLTGGGIYMLVSKDVFHVWVGAAITGLAGFVSELLLEQLKISEETGQKLVRNGLGPAATGGSLLLTGLPAQWCVLAAGISLASRVASNFVIDSMMQ